MPSGALRKIAASKMSELATKVVFHSFDSIMGVLTQDKFKEKYPVDEIMNTYKEAAEIYSIPVGQKRHPFVVLEGLDGCGKTTISKRLVEKIDGVLLATPPASITKIRHIFEDDKILRTAYYSFGNYLAQMEIMAALKTKPVILDRFWHSTAAYALAQSIYDGFLETLPPRHDSIYNWPSDLTKPDVVILLEISEEERQKRHAERNTTNTNQEQLIKAKKDFRNNIIQAYKYMTNPDLKFINVDGPVEQCVDNIYESIKHLFHDKS